MSKHSKQTNMISNDTTNQVIRLAFIYNIPVVGPTPFHSSDAPYGLGFPTVHKVHQEVLAPG